MFYQSVVASVLFYAVVCWGGSSKKRDAAQLDRLVRKAGSVVDAELDSLVTVAERRTLNRTLSIMDNTHHPLHSTFTRQRRVIQPTEDVFASERDTVTLDCTFETNDTNPFLFWYRQEAGDFPKYMLRCYSNKAENAPGISEDRFKAAINGKSVPLKIQKLQLTDSAVYYCALRPTVTGNTTTLCVSCEDLTPVKNEEHSLEDSTVTLSYSYSKQAVGNDYFFWYRQYPGKQPQFIISHSSTGRLISDPVSGLSVRVREDKKHLDLQISSAALTDSAVYYCSVKEKTE
ncbi:uncharacterized protein [Labrus bergylta]|uniref:uncharacterized protein n=1 Tax=Labrus bergylta TaxID=56723 RepID=UPI0033144D3D